MSDVRLSPQTLFPSYLAPGPFQAATPSVGAEFADPQATDTPGATPASAFSLLDGAAGTAPSDPVASATLLQVQADAASSITDPNGIKSAEQVARGADSGASGASLVMERIGKNGGRLGHKLGVLGPGFGVLGEAAGMPAAVASMTKSIGQAMETGSLEDVTKATGDTAAFGSASASMVKGVLEVPEAWVRGQARRNATTAFRQSAPNASKAVVNAAAKEAAAQAMKESTAKATRRAVQKAAVDTAKAKGTLAGGAGVVGRAAASKVLNQGGKAAAEAATKAVAKSALKTAAKAGARFVPGLNIAIAGLDSAAALATVRDPKASFGKKAASVITAAGSIAAATNWPLVSQTGAVVSAVSSFAGSFF